MDFRIVETVGIGTTWNLNKTEPEPTGIETGGGGKLGRHVVWELIRSSLFADYVRYLQARGSRTGLVTYSGRRYFGNGGGGRALP